MKLEKPIIFFDEETTGTSTEADRIVELACIKYFPDGTIEEKYTLINPEISIPKEASDVHGITDDRVQSAPTFKQLAVSMREWFKDSDLAGFNSDRFDVPLLSAEFERAGLEGINWNPSLYDILTLYRKLFPNTLSEVYKRLTGNDLDGAHGAIFDVRGTKEIADILFPLLVEQAETPIETVKDIDEYLQGENKRYDLSGKMYKDSEGIVRWNFSKNKDLPVKKYDSFNDWFFKQSFSKESKDKLKQVISKL